MNKLKISINKLNYWVNPNGYKTFWNLVNQGKWELETFSVFDSNINYQTLFIDIGGWIGPTSLYGAQLAKKTLSLEPDPFAYRRLKENLNLNTFFHKKIKLLNLALWSEETSISFISDTKIGDSTSSVMRDNKSGSKNICFEAKTITFENLIKKINLNEFNKVFVKIDIEGAEYMLFDFLLEKLSDINAAFLVSTHPWLLNKKSKKGVIRRFNQAYDHWKFCQKIKKYNYKLRTSSKKLPYIPLINSIGWILIGRMHQDILATPDKI